MFGKNNHIQIELSLVKKTHFFHARSPLRIRVPISFYLHYNSKTFHCLEEKAALDRKQCLLQQSLLAFDFTERRKLPYLSSPNNTRKF